MYRIGAFDLPVYISAALRFVCIACLFGCGESGPIPRADASDGSIDAPKDGALDGNEDMTDAVTEPEWRLIAQTLKRGLVSVWGASASDVWSVGGDDGKGDGPIVIHYDGTSFSHVTTGTQGTLWWVFGFADGPVYMGGENGLVLRYANGEFETLATPSDSTVYGIWGAGDDLWAVGGQLDGSTGAQIWKLEDDDFVIPDGLTTIETSAIFKVWGCSENNVWFVGTGGTIIHWDGEAFEPVESNANDRTLFTVHVEPDTCMATAVGGYGSGEIVENSGSGWVNVTPTGIFATNGVNLVEGGGFAVGIQGQVLKRIDGTWQTDPTPPEWSSFFLHAVWVDPDGGAWSVGADSGGFPTDDGVMIYRGTADIAPLTDP